MQHNELELALDMLEEAFDKSGIDSATLSRSKAHIDKMRPSCCWMELVRRCLDNSLSLAYTRLATSFVSKENFLDDFPGSCGRTGSSWMNARKYHFIKRIAVLVCPPKTPQLVSSQLHNMPV